MIHRAPLVRIVPVTVLAMAACQEAETPSAPPPLEPGPEPTAPPPRVAQPAMGVEGYATPGEVRTGFILGRDGEPVQITYEVQGELAIWEGDIVIGRAAEIPGTLAELMARPQRGVVIDGAGFRWPGGVVPYEIDPALPNQARVTQAIAQIEDETPGVTLVPRSGEADYVRFVDGGGCSSPIGRQGGMQTITLADGCSAGNAAHEILHALGMYHEHTRCDRDTYVVINSANIESGKEHNFDKNCSGATDYFDYDAGSMMHYGPFAFSKNGLKTIESNHPSIDEDDMGQRTVVGPTDVQTIELLYGANNAAPVAVIGALAPTYPEGSPVPLDGSGSSDADDSDDVLTYAWTFGDGTCSGTPPAACTQEVTSNTYADDGAYPVTLTVSDGFLDDTDNATATIVNVDPVVSAGPDASVDEGSPWTRSGSFTDPGADTWSATVDYGDGTGSMPLPLAGKTFDLSHTYVDNGVYTVTVTVTDDDGGVGADDVQVTVNNVAPIVDAGPDAVVTSAETYDFSGTFSDPGVEDDPWSWEIDWGFGANTAGVTDDQSAAIEASRQVCVAGDYTVTLSVTDKDGGTGTDALTLTVPYVAIDIDVTPGSEPNPVNLGKKGQLPIAILGSADFDAAAVDPATVVVGDEAGVSDTPVSQKVNGTWQAAVEDVNGDGYPDMVVKVDVPALVANGDVHALSTTVVLRGFLDDGCTNFRGEAPITVLD